jgi:hypothetical protein
MGGLLVAIATANASAVYWAVIAVMDDMAPARASRFSSVVTTRPRLTLARLTLAMSLCMG